MVATYRTYGSGMDKAIAKYWSTGHSPARRAGIISAVEVLIAFTATGVTYLALFGLDEGFWKIITLAFIVPWIICLPANFYGVKRRQQLMDMAAELRDTQEKLQRMNSELELRANIDGLTGLTNREHFIRTFDRRRRESENNVLLIIDVDHFKSINDGYGHPVGDRALVSISSVFKYILRKGDLVGRIGGEEFGVLLPDSCEAEGEVIAEMIRYEIEHILFEPQLGVFHRMTVSIGLTGVSAYDDRAVAMRNADSALFEAKHRGRNQYVRYVPGMRDKPRPFYEAMGRQGPIRLRA